MTSPTELNPLLEAITLMLLIGAFTLVGAVTAIILIGFRRYYRERWTFHGDWGDSPVPVAKQPEALVAKMRIGSGNHMVSVFETDGKNSVLIEGPASDREKKRLLRYLKSEGFI